jgi:Phage tail tube protein, TTP
MPDVTRWIKVAVAMQSALGADKTISGITLANPGVVTSTSHGLSDGNYVKYTITNGMQQLANRVLRIAGSATNTWQIEGIDTSSGYDAFVSGKANLVTFGTSFSTLMEVSPSGGDQQFITYRLLHDDVENQIPSVKSPTLYTFRSIWDPADAALLAAETASDQAAQRAIRMTFSNGKIYVFNGFVGFNFAPGGQAGELVECTLTINAQGRGKAYAS